MQEASGEIWGRPPIFSPRPMVQAYGGPLPEGVRGVEFDADVLPDRGGKPALPTWSGLRPGVVVEDGFAKIKATITKNTQT